MASAIIFIQCVIRSEKLVSKKLRELPNVLLVESICDEFNILIHLNAENWQKIKQLVDKEIKPLLHVKGVMSLRISTSYGILILLTKKFNSK